jgi:sugar/nucleoside kinase (ribokinase family)
MTTGLSEKEYDLIFIGHVCYDEAIYTDGHHSNSLSVGGAAVYGAVAAAKADKKVAALLMLDPQDRKDIDFLTDAGIDLFTIDSSETTRVQVIHASSDMDDRTIITQKYAGVFEEQMIPPLTARNVHLAGCNDHEFTIDFIKSMKARGYSLSADMQSFVRYNQPETGQICFRNDPNAKDLMQYLDKVKLDILEAGILTGSTDLVKASSIVRSWGCPEMLVTCSDGVLCREGDSTWFAKFSNRRVLGRTGRGDTTFGAYLARRIDHKAEESLNFAAALVSLKMEKSGPFNGTLDDVLCRINES